jgi:hypothetical protein
LEILIDPVSNPNLLGLHCLNGHNIFIKEKKMEMLKCSGKFSICGETKPISEFNKSLVFSNKPFGVDPTCKACRYARVKDRKNEEKNTDNINRLVQDAVNKVLKEKGINNKIEQPKANTLEDLKNIIKPFIVGKQTAGGYRIRYQKTIDGHKIDIHLGSFANDSEERVVRRAEIMKNAFNEILLYNRVNFKF